MNLGKYPSSVHVEKSGSAQINDQLSRFQGTSQIIPNPTEFRDEGSGDSAFNLERYSLSLVLDRDFQLCLVRFTDKTLMANAMPKPFVTRA